MRRLMQKLANVMAAVAFAEEGDAETAKQLLAEDEPEERSDPGDRRDPLLPPGHRTLAKSS